MRRGASRFSTGIQARIVVDTSDLAQATAADRRAISTRIIGCVSGDAERARPTVYRAVG